MVSRALDMSVRSEPEVGFAEPVEDDERSQCGPGGIVAVEDRTESIDIDGKRFTAGHRACVEPVVGLTKTISRAFRTLKMERRPMAVAARSFPLDGNAASSLLETSRGATAGHPRPRIEWWAGPNSSVRIKMGCAARFVVWWCCRGTPRQTRRATPR